MRTGRILTNAIPSAGSRFASFLRSRTILAAVAACLFASTATASDVFDAWGFNRNRDFFSQLPFEHVDPLTGNLLLTFTDLVLPGNAGFDLRIQRTYNSKIYRDYHTFGETLGEDSWAGVGWSLDLGRVIGADVGTPYPVVEMSDGSRHQTYLHVTPPSGCNPCYVTRDYWIYNRTNQTLKLPNGLTYVFGHLVTMPNVGTVRYVTQISDLFGNQVSVAYMTGASAPPDGISTITQSLGGGQQRVVSFGLNATYKSIASMTYTGATTHTWNYTSQLANGGYSLLSQVTPPVGPAWQYQYKTASPAKYALKGITTPNGGQIDYTYQEVTFNIGSTVPVRSLVVNNRSASGRDVPAGSWSYAYAQGAAKNQSTITSPCGTTTTHTFLGVGTYSTPGDAWKVGLPSVKSLAEGSNTLETESYTWWPPTAIDRISDDDQIIGNNVDTEIYVPLLHTRTLSRGGSNYVTTNSYHHADFNDYGRPYQIDETGQLSRQTTRTFEYASGSWKGFSLYLVDGRLKSETETVAGESFTKNWSYNLSNGFRTNATVYGISTDFAPSAQGNVASRTDANSHTTSFTYEWGVAKNITPPVAGTQTTRVINPEGTVASETRRGFTTSFQYDGLFRRTRITPPVGNALVTSYDNSGGASFSVTRGPNGSGGTSSVTTFLDGLGRVTGTSNSVGVRTRLAYDACGRQDYASLPYTTSDVGTSFDYDGLGRLTRKTNADNSYAAYAYNGIDVTVTDEEGRVTVQDRTAFGDPDETRLASLTAAKNTGIQQTTSYTYNAVGSLKLVTLPGGKTRSFTYNTKNQLINEKHPEIEGSTSVSYTYDDAGNLETRSDPHGTSIFDYDGNDRLIGVNRPGVEHDTTPIQYDGSDNRTFVSSGMAGSSLSPLITSSFAFDGANRLMSRTDVVDGKSFTTSYGYDGNDNRTDINYPSGPQIDYAFDSEGRITLVSGGGTTYASTFQYHPSGALSSFRPGGSNFTQQFSFDPWTYRPTSIDTGVLDLSYGYDDVGNVTSISDPRPGMSQSFGYDKLDRLEDVLSGPGTGSFGYNALGDRTSKTSGGSVSYSYDGTTLRLQSAGGQSFQHDASGNMTVDGLGNYTYTPDNTMDRAITGGGTTTYWYDADLLRKAKLGPSGEQFFVHGPGNQLLAEFEPDCTGTPRPTRSYVYAGSRLIAAIRPTDLSPSVGFVTTSSSISEAGGSVSVSVRLTTPGGAATTCPVTVNYSTGGGTATAGADYTPKTGTLTFPTGSASGATQTVAIAILDDSVDELAETLTLSLSSPHGALLGQSSHNVTLLDNDPPALSVNDVSAFEGSSGTTSLSFTVSLSTPAEAPVSVSYATSDGSAVAGSDYTSASGSLSFAIGDSTKTVTVQVNGDTAYEEDETFKLDLSAPSGATMGDGQGVATLRNDDGEVTVPAGLVPPGGSVNATVKGGTSALDWVGVFKVNAPDNDPGVVKVYVPSPRPTTMALTVPTVLGFYNVRFFANDTLYKFSTSQTFQVGTGPTLFIDDLTVAEGNAGTTSASFNVLLSPPATQTVTVNYATSDGTATSGTDFAWSVGTLTFLAGETSKTVTVTVNGDTTAEANETFFLNFANATGGAMIANVKVQGMISNDDASAGPLSCPAQVAPGAAFTSTVTGGSSATDWMALYAAGAPNTPLPSNWRYVPLPRPSTQNFTASTTPGAYELRLFANDTYTLIGTCAVTVAAVSSVTINDVFVTEGNAGSVNASFTVTLSPAAGGTVTVQYALADGSATAGTDYVWSSGTLTFAAGETTKSVAVTVNADTASEPNETFFVNLGSPTGGAMVADNQGLGTITDDDALSCPATVSPGAAFNVTVSGGSSAQDWLAMYTPAAPDNPLPSNWRYVPLPRPSTQAFTASATPGTYELRLFANGGYTRISTCSVNVVAPPTLTINDVSVTEGNAGSVNATFTVTLNPAASGTVTVNYATANNTATAGTDYTSTSGTLTFAASETTKTVTVQVTGDTTSESNETFQVNLSAATGGATIGDSQGVGTIVDDDAAPAVSCPSTVNPGASFSATVNAGSSATDWLAMYAAGAPNTPLPSNWRYVPLPRPSTQNFTASSTAGSYELRLFANDTYTLIGSCPFTVATVPTLSVNDASVTEGNAGNVNASFTVTLSPAAAGTVTVDYASANNTATAGSDYTSTSGTLTFAAGETTKTVTVQVTGDTAPESNESFFLNLSGATGGAAIGDGQGLGTIVDDDAPPAVSCPSTVNPGASFSATVNAGSSATDWLAMYASGAPNTPLPSNWRYVPLPRPSTQNFTASSTAGSYELRLFANDTYTLIGTCPFTVATVPALTINDVTVTEGNAGTVNASFTATLSPGASGTVTVDYGTANNTATAGSDYTSTSGTLTFAVGETTKTVTVTVTGETAYEPNETYFVNLSGATGGAVIGDSQGVGTITDDDAVSCPASATAGASFSVTVNIGSSSTDWLALYTAGAANDPVPSNWRYVPLPRPNTQSFTASTTPGSYQVRLFANDSATVIGSCNVQVTP